MMLKGIVLISFLFDFSASLGGCFNPYLFFLYFLFVLLSVSFISWSSTVEVTFSTGPAGATYWRTGSLDGATAALRGARLGA